MSSLMNSIKHKNKRNNINSSQTLLENRIGGNTSQLILCGQHSLIPKPDMMRKLWDIGTITLNKKY